MLKKIVEIQFAEGIVGEEREEFLKTLEEMGFTIVIDQDYYDETRYFVVRDYKNKGEN